MSLPENYINALGRLGAAFAAYEASTGHTAILVGGAAAAIHTDGAFMSADFDVVAGADQAFADAMAAAGFVPDEKAVHGLGWYHPAYPSFGVEQDSGGFFDGRGERDRCLRLVVEDEASIVLPAVEDMIADRLGQHEIAKGDPSMLEQARALFTLGQDLDVTYLVRRIREEGGNPSLLGIS